MNSRPADHTWFLNPVGMPSVTSGACHNGSPMPHAVESSGAWQFKSASSPSSRQTLSNPDTNTWPFAEYMFEVESAPCTRPAASKSRALLSTSTTIGMLSVKGIRKSELTGLVRVANFRTKLVSGLPDSTKTIADSSSRCVSKYCGNTPDRPSAGPPCEDKCLATRTSRAPAPSKGSMTFRKTGKSEPASRSVSKTLALEVDSTGLMCAPCNLSTMECGTDNSTCFPESSATCKTPSISISSRSFAELPALRPALFLSALGSGQRNLMPRASAMATAASKASWVSHRLSGSSWRTLLMKSWTSSACFWKNIWRFKPKWTHANSRASCHNSLVISPFWRSLLYTWLRISFGLVP
mmetsp:Transcript_25350/g.73116  ORF Transcript_25350/g.73116 Transcript_25350/m.73116 type:complete len:353 (+) Transcript_25350:514-1572(+)